MRLALAAERLGRVDWPDFSDDLASLAIPAFLYEGELASGCADARRGAALIPGASFLARPGLGHTLAQRPEDGLLDRVRALLRSAE